jgi:hypothetical protein
MKRPQRAVAWLFATATSCVAVATLGGQTTPAPLVLAPPGSNIAIVRTWKDLSNQPVIDTAEGPVHLGIEATTAPAYGTVLLYARFDAMRALEKRREATARVLLGPLRVRVRSKGMFENAASWGMADQPASDGPHFYVVGVPLGPAGDYDIQIHSENGQIAAVHVTVTDDDTEHFWPLAGRRPKNEEDIETFHLDPEPAVPAFDGGPSRPLPQGDLPTSAVPTKESADLLVSVNGTRVTVASWPGTRLPPEYQLLTRVFVNGKSVQRPVPTSFRARADSFTTPRFHGALQFDLDIDRTLLPAAGDDKVEVQFLFCPDGIERLGHNLGPRLVGDKPLMLSNRVEIPGPPATAPTPE